MCFNRILVKSILLFGLALSMVGCSKAPDPQDDIPLFDTFIAENIDKVSDDPYISSTVRPGDKMYDFLVSLQHGSGGKNFLDPLLDNDDPEAMLWEGRLILPVMRLRGKAYRLIHGAMQAGNPYAALELSEGSESCRYYFGKNSAGNKLAEMVGMGASNESGVCSEDNFALALKGFEELAKEGDLRAQYFLLKQKSWDQSTETRAEYIQEIIRFAKAHYYQPLMDYVGTILFYSKEENKDISNTQEQHELAIKLLTIASNNNYIPAIRKLFLSNNDEQYKKELENKSLNLGDTEMVVYLFYEVKKNSTEQYYYNLLFKELTGQYKSTRVKVPNESSKVEAQAKAFAKTIHSSVYIDGFTDSGDWH
ncbi:sel1 repeat family protein [Vibrio parahaemolyticus]|uniref:sel1 repeat family protein n=1 Tax=Vibrio parahaemolyticus TaxID=670 RepID=UPI0022B3A282|nr:sel1 repeat family protein [Vibrio parahaemolyticus]MCZ5878883.1 sel1 repeat family protein [Vibrio parahaemolyticus]MCZ6369588.1 sel1 repeat family protein [Vibrio parahaemolyticus]MDF4893903.1 sel1 repeat family protein [Vibrio parahaemolyticus]MDG3395329.1 sel1 repeat family protein [Vibrio parahaemolyticus]